MLATSPPVLLPSIFHIALQKTVRRGLPSRIGESLGMSDARLHNTISSSLAAHYFLYDKIETPSTSPETSFFQLKYWFKNTINCLRFQEIYFTVLIPDPASNKDYGGGNLSVNVLSGYLLKHAIYIIIKLGISPRELSPGHSFCSIKIYEELFLSMSQSAIHPVLSWEKYSL